MKTLALFVRSTILGGVFFLAPIIVLIVILAKAFGYAKDDARDIATLRARGYCFVAGDRVEEIAAAVRFPHANLPGPNRNVRARERGRRV